MSRAAGLRRFGRWTTRFVAENVLWNYGSTIAAGAWGSLLIVAGAAWRSLGVGPAILVFFGIGLVLYGAIGAFMSRRRKPNSRKPKEQPPPEAPRAQPLRPTGSVGMRLSETARGNTFIGGNISGFDNGIVNEGTENKWVGTTVRGPRQQATKPDTDDLSEPAEPTSEPAPPRRPRAIIKRTSIINSSRPAIRGPAGTDYDISDVYMKDVAGGIEIDGDPDGPVEI